MTCALIPDPPASFSHQAGGVRYYRLRTGELVPSVSSIVHLVARDGLRPWAIDRALEHLEGLLRPYAGKRLPPEVFQLAIRQARHRPDAQAYEAASIGRQVHAAVGHLAVTGALSPGAEALPVDWQGLRGFLAQRPHVIWHAEVIVADPATGAAGSADLVGVGPEGATLVDIKTSPAPYETHFLQVGGYASLLKAMGVDVTEGYILLLPRSGKARAVAVELPRYMEAFRHLAAAFRLLRPQPPGPAFEEGPALMEEALRAFEEEDGPSKRHWKGKTMSSGGG